MLNENIKAMRRSKGLSQEELAVKLNVVRQTVSKWERGLSVPDSDMLIALSEALEAPVGTLLGETVTASKPDDLKAIIEKLEVINLQLSRRKSARRQALLWMLIAICAAALLCLGVLVSLGSAYQGWDWSDPETAVFGTAFHVFEWVSVRLAPIMFIGSAIGIVIVLVKKKGQ